MYDHLVDHRMMFKSLAPVSCRRVCSRWSLQARGACVPTNDGVRSHLDSDSIAHIAMRGARQDAPSPCQGVTRTFRSFSLGFVVSRTVAERPQHLLVTFLGASNRRRRWVLHEFEYTGTCRSCLRVLFWLTSLGPFSAHH